MRSFVALLDKAPQLYSSAGLLGCSPWSRFSITLLSVVLIGATCCATLSISLPLLGDPQWLSLVDLLAALIGCTPRWSFLSRSLIMLLSQAPRRSPRLLSLASLLNCAPWPCSLAALLGQDPQLWFLVDLLGHSPCSRSLIELLVVLLNHASWLISFATLLNHLSGAKLTVYQGDCASTGERDRSGIVG